MNSPKVGVLTFHRCINYGSYWQARCLVEGLRGRGAEAFLLDHCSARVNWAEWRCALQPLLPVRASKADQALYAAKTRKFFEAFERLPLSPPFSLENPQATERYDLVLVGSDEVWNLRHPWYSYYPLFYGEGLRAGRLASYAASFGNHDVAEGLDCQWADKLRAFAHISVRDKNSRQLIRDAIGLEAQLVLDPCLQFADKIAPTGETEIQEPYFAIYGHGFPDWFAQSVRQWAGARGLKLASIGYRNDWADEQWIDAGPEAFAQFMAGSAAIATNFFHGCVFSLLNDKPFACTMTDYRSNKITDLMEELGAQRHLFAEPASRDAFEAVLGQSPEGAIGEKIAMLRQQSNAYLDHVLA